MTIIETKKHPRKFGSFIVVDSLNIVVEIGEALH
jgi:hypothetical protein